MNSLQNRSIVTMALLTIITCGIYMIYYLITTQDQIRASYSKELLPSGITVFLLGIVTCGIYTIYWMYKTSKVLNDIAKKNGVDMSDDTILLVLLGAFFSFAVYAIILQTKINLIAIPSNQTINV